METLTKDTLTNIPYDDNDVSPIVKDIVINLFEKCKKDIQNNKQTREINLNQKHSKIKETYQKENQHIIDLEKDILSDQNQLQKLNLVYLLEKKNISNLENTVNQKDVEYKNLIDIYQKKITNNKNNKSKLLEKMELQKQLYDEQLEHQNKQLSDEIEIYNNEIERIKQYKINIEVELQNKLAQTIADLETYDAKITNKTKIIQLLHSEIKGIEKFTSNTRRQMIKNNQIFINRHKNLRKVKQRFQTQIANINSELYTLNNNKIIEIKRLTDINTNIENEYRKNITDKNQNVKELSDKLSEMDNNVVNQSSKTWQKKYNTLSNELDVLHQDLTSTIQEFNVHLSKKREILNNVEIRYKNDIENKNHELKILEIKLQKIHNGEDSQISKINNQHQLNNKIMKEKMDLLNNEYQSLQQIYRNKYEYQCLANQYESDANSKIVQIGEEIERAQERLTITKKRFTNNVKLYDKKYRNAIADYATELEKCKDNIDDNDKMIQNIVQLNKNNHKEVSEYHNKLRQIRNNIKDLERDIKSKNARLENLKVRIETRLKTIKEREQEVIDAKLKNDLEFVTKMNKLNNMNDGTISQKIEVLNNLMGINI